MGAPLTRGPPTIVVAALSAPSAEDADTATRLTTQLRATVSHMRGLRLVEAEGSSGRGAADLRLSGVVTHAGRQPVAALTLSDQRSGARLWAATFDGAAISDPTVEERAVSATARYLAIWLGDRMSGQPTAREPPNPEVARIVSGALQTLADAHEARHNRDWPRLAQLVRETTTARDRALAIDPNAASALMLGYEIEAMPEFRRPDETQAGFEARRRAAQLLARALAADPDEPQALAAAAHEFTRDRRWDEAGKLLERAVALDPNSADANTWYAYHLGLMGQCRTGLRYARIGAGLAPGQTWRQMAVPRLLHCAGRHDDAERAYRALLAKDPTNVFVLREVYLMLFARRDVPRLRALTRDVRDRVWRGAPPLAIAAMLARMTRAADALEGRPGPFLSLVDLDRLDLESRTPSEITFGGSRGDQLFGLALEYAEAGAVEPAMVTLRLAVEAGSLYLPWALPYGPTEFPAALRADPAYAALWKSTPGLVTLMARRQRSQAALRP